MLLLQKTLINIEGMARSLVPDMDLWKEVRPLVNVWIQKRSGVRPLLRIIQRDTRMWSSDLEFLLPRAGRLLQQLDKLSSPERVQKPQRSDSGWLVVGLALCLLPSLR